MAAPANVEKFFPLSKRKAKNKTQITLAFLVKTAGKWQVPASIHHEEHEPHENECSRMQEIESRLSGTTD
jgi:hypothetical protein